MIKNKIILSSLAAGFLLVSMTGCGSNNSTTSNTDPVVDEINQITGAAVDGYIRNGLVCLDMNSNNECDDNEPYSKTSTDGTYALDISNVTEAQRNTAKILVSGGIDAATGRAFTSVLKAPLGDEAIINITPITTIVAAKVQNKADIDQAMLDVANSLNLTVNELKLDPLKAENKEIFEAGLKIQKSLEILQEAVKQSGSATEAADNFVKLSEKLAEGFNGISSDVDTIVDNTDFSEVVGLEDANIVKNLIKKINQTIVTNGTATIEELEKLSYLIENLKEQIKQDIEDSKIENSFSETEYDDSVLLVDIEDEVINFDENKEKIKKMLDVIDFDAEDAEEDRIVSALLVYQKDFRFNSTLLEYKTIISSMQFSEVDLPIKYLLLEAIERKILEYKGIDSNDDTLAELKSGFRLFSVRAEMNYNNVTTMGEFDNFSASIEDIRLGDTTISFNKTSMDYGIDGYVFYNDDDTTWFDGQNVVELTSRIHSDEDVVSQQLVDGIYRYEDEMGQYHYEVVNSQITNRHEVRNKLVLRNGIWVTETEDDNETPEAIVYNEDGTVTVTNSDERVETQVRLVASEDISGKTTYVPVRGTNEFIETVLSPESKRYIIELKEGAREIVELHQKIEDHADNGLNNFANLNDFFTRFNVATLGNTYSSLFHDNEVVQEQGVQASYQFKGDLATGYGEVVKSISVQDPTTFVFSKTEEFVVGKWEVKQINGVDTIFLSGYNVDRIFSQHNGGDWVFENQAFIYTVVNNTVYQGVSVKTQAMDRTEILYNEKATQDIAQAIDAFAETAFNKIFEDITLP